MLSCVMIYSAKVNRCPGSVLRYNLFYPESVILFCYNKFSITEIEPQEIKSYTLEEHTILHFLC